MGNGRQYMSWIAIDDLMSVVLFALENPAISGPLNVVAPDPVTNRDFTRTLAQVISRPAFLPVPSFVLRMLPGKMANETFLASSRVEPARLRTAGFKFQYPELEGALRHVLGRLT